MKAFAATVLTALVFAPSAFAHAEIAPQTGVAGRWLTVELTVPTESATAATVAVHVLPVAGLTFDGITAWHGRTRGIVRLRLHVKAAHGGDYRLRVEQRYADGELVDWFGASSSNTPAPVLHVSGRSDNSRDRVIIIAAFLVVAGAAAVLRRLRQR